MKTISVIEMEYSKSTKNTHMYGANNVIPTLYINKSAFEEGNKPPKSIRVTVEEVDG